MPTAKPRIQVTLTKDQYEVLNAISQANGRPMSKMVSDLIAEMMPVFVQMRDLMGHVEHVHHEGRAKLVEALEQSQEAFEPLLKQAVGEWEKFADRVCELGQGDGQAGGPQPVITGATKLERRGGKSAGAALHKVRRQVVRNRGLE